MKKNDTLIWIGISAIAIYVLYLLYRRYIKMEFSLRGIEFLKKLEGVRNKMYYDSVGLPTIGVGHLIILPQEQYLMTKTLTDSEVNDLLRKDLKRFVDSANDAIIVPVNQNEFDAVVSILFNVGTGWAKKASFIKSINSRADKKEVVRNMMKFRQPPEIISRRAREARLFETGNYSATITQAEVNKYLSI